MSFLDANMNEIGQRRRSLAETLHIDIPLLMGIIALAATSLVILYSASGQDMTMVWKQVIRFVIAFAVLLVLAQISSNAINRWTPYIYAIGVVLLLAVGLDQLRLRLGQS